MNHGTDPRRFRPALAAMVVLLSGLLLIGPMSAAIAQTADPTGTHTESPSETLDPCESPSPSPTPTGESEPTCPSPTEPSPTTPPPDGGGTGGGGTGGGGTGGDGGGTSSGGTGGDGGGTGGGGTGGDGGGSGGGGTDGGGTGGGDGRDRENDSRHSGGGDGRSDKGGARGDRANRAATYSGFGTNSGTIIDSDVPSGTFSTDRLVEVALELRSLGWSERRTQEVFVPFILAGEASWINTWGAPRYGPGDLVRTHEGQDVFCNYGDPVLAVEPGTIEYDEQSLGGKIARLHTSGGDYWYYAHMSDYADLSNGDPVAPGDVIGYCGNSGNAISTPPHVHFGHYLASGNSVNPMADLVKWLRQAERRAGVLPAGAADSLRENVSDLTILRRFGDDFIPEPSERLPEPEPVVLTRVLMASFLGSPDENIAF